jgi:lipid II:glycine glycyltransferase (peptidoglycan interpeptide bridge formation enzyme)
MPVTVRPVSPAEHLAWIESHGPVSFLQTPAWGRVKSEWHHESVGWFDGEVLLGCALVLFRPIPVVGYTLAYVPEGPHLPFPALFPADAVPAPPSSATSPRPADAVPAPPSTATSSPDPGRFTAAAVSDYLAALVRFAASRRAFALTIGPPVWWRRWLAPTVKEALAGEAQRFTDVPADRTNPAAEALMGALGAARWRPPAHHEGFSAGQPDFVFQLPLAGRTEEDILAGFNQLWRRNIRKAAAAGVAVTHGERADLPAFHALYAETALRDGFTPRPLAYFTQMWDAEAAEAPDRLTLYLAHHGADLVAATIALRVPGHAWYVYGASSTAKREVRGSNAVQWAMMRDAIVHGDQVYDMRGITETTDPADPHAGLIQFKVGTGGHAQQYLGEWTYVIRPALHRVYQLAMARRARRKG